MEISTEDFINKKSPLRVVETYYKIQKIIGKGAFGVVYKAFELCSGRIVAIKQIPIDSTNRKDVIKEIELLKNLEHPNIVKYYNYLKEDNHIYIIMEYLEGSTLKQYITHNSENITEDIARNIIKQLLNALSYLHYSCDVCHRDIKPENIMFTEKNDISYIKLLDFGLSSDAFESKLKTQNCGTLTYMAPEQISSLRYSKAVDIWSVGIVLYKLLNKGKNPFYQKGDSNSVLIDNINNQEVEFDLENCPISVIGRHLIYKLLDKNPSYRYTARLALSHPWITLNKFDKIPMTLYDKIIEDENVTKLNMLLIISSFMFYYKKNFLVAKNDINNNKNFLKSDFLSKYDNDEVSKTDDENMDNYERNVLKSNKIYYEKFKENRENMFLPKCNTSKEVNTYLLKLNKNKIENKKNEDLEKNIDNDNNENNKDLEIYSDKEVYNNEDNIDIKDKRRGKKSSMIYGSISVLSQYPKKSILKKNNMDISPTNLKYNKKNNQISNEQGMTPDVNNHLKRYDQKLSNKLITFRLSVASKDVVESKNINKHNPKNIVQKPIKLQSIKNNKEIINKSKSHKILDGNNDNNQTDLDGLNNKSSKSTKNFENSNKKLSTDNINRNVKNINDLKVSYSVDLKFNKINENNKKKINYKPIKLKEEYDEIENKLNLNLFSTKSKINKKKLSNSYLTVLKKNKNKSVDKSIFIQPKKLFQNNSILPPIQNK